MKLARLLLTAPWVATALCLVHSPSAHAQSFSHPGILHTKADLDRMASKVSAGAQPWKAGWDKLVANPFSQTSYNPNPQADVCAGNVCVPGETYMPLARDAAAAYQNALRYRISGDSGNGDKAVSILNAWSATLQKFSGDSNAGLRTGLYGYQLAAAGELMRDYTSWAAADFARFKNMLLTIFYPTSSDFLRRHNGTCPDHYWANWDLANMTTIIAIAVLTDDRAKFDEAVNYFKTGIGTGQVDNLVRFLYPGDRPGHFLGQGQEAGRDQGHATLDISLIGAFCKIAYDQGDDLFAYEDNKVLALSEYTAKYNLNQDVPWTNYTNCQGDAMTAVASASRGTIRPSWELLYNHYVTKKGLYAAYSQQFAEKVRPEGGGGDYGTSSGGFDQLGFGTLTFTEDAADSGIGAVGGTSGADGGSTAGSSGMIGAGGAFGLAGAGGMMGGSVAGAAGGQAGNFGTAGNAGTGVGDASAGSGGMAPGGSSGSDASARGPGAGQAGRDSGCSCGAAGASCARATSVAALALLALSTSGLRRRRRRRR